MTENYLLYQVRSIILGVWKKIKPTTIKDYEQRLTTYFSDYQNRPFLSVEYDKEHFCCRHMVLVLYKHFKKEEFYGIRPRLKLRFTRGDSIDNSDGHIWLGFNFHGFWYIIDASGSFYITSKKHCEIERAKYKNLFSYFDIMEYEEALKDWDLSAKQKIYAPLLKRE